MRTWLIACFLLQFLGCHLYAHPSTVCPLTRNTTETKDLEGQQKRYQRTIQRLAYHKSISLKVVKIWQCECQLPAFVQAWSSFLHKKHRACFSREIAHCHWNVAVVWLWSLFGYTWRMAKRLQIISFSTVVFFRCWTSDVPYKVIREHIQQHFERHNLYKKKGDDFYCLVPKQKEFS